MSIPNTCHQFSLLLMIVLKYLTCVLTITEGSKNCALWNTTQIKVKKKKSGFCFLLFVSVLNQPLKTQTGLT